MNTADLIINGDFDLSNYDNNKKKKKKKTTTVNNTPIRNTADSIINGSFETDLPINHISPLKKTSKKEEKEKKRTWFNSGAFADGYQFGDITKTITGTATDIYGDLTGGALKLGERVIDTGASFLGKGAELTGNKKLADSTSKFIQRDLLSESGIVERITNNSVTGVANNILNGNFKAMNPFSKENSKTDTAEKNSVLGEKSDSLTQSGGQLVAQIGLQTVGVPWFVTSGISGYGAGVEEGLKQGATYNEAMTSGAINAGAEILTEKLFKGSGLGEKGLINLRPQAVNGIKNEVVKTFAKFGIDMAGEGAEEVASEVISNIGKGLTYEDDKTINELLFSKEAFENYLESFIGGAVLGGGANTVKVSDSIRSGRDYDTGLTASERQAVDSEVQRRIAEKEKAGTKLTNNQKAEIENQVITQVKQQSNNNITTQQINSNLTTDASSNTLNSDNSTRLTAYKYFGKDNQNINETLDILDDIKTKRSNETGTLNIEFDDTVGANGVHIVQGNNRTIKVNPKSKNYLEQILVHELAHDTENSKTYNELKSYINSIATKDGSYTQAKESLTKAYKEYYEKNGLDFSKVDMDIETTNDILGKAIGNQEFLSSLAKEKPSLFERIYEYIKNVLFDGNKTGRTLKERQQLNKIQSMFNKAMNEAYIAKANGTKHMIVGINGIKEMAKTSNSAKSAEVLYDEATNSSEDNETIRENTGWFKDKNGAWKFEISDDKAKTYEDSNKLIKPKQDKEYRLDQIFEHKALFKAYPELINSEKPLMIKFFTNNDRSSGRFDYKNNIIEINYDVIEGYTVSDLKQVLLHELQHYVQHKEGFEYGRSSKNAYKYTRSLGEIEATDTENRVKLTPDERLTKRPESSKKNPIHPNRDKIIKSRGNNIDKLRTAKDKLFEKIDNRKENMYNIFKEGADNEKNNLLSPRRNIENNTFNNNNTVSNIDDSSFNEKNRRKNMGDSGEVDSNNKNNRLHNIQGLDNSSFFNAKNQQTDNKGRKLSKEQQTKFKDSKVRDENGKLLTVYHGTRSDFNVFKNNKSGDNYEGWSYSGKGFYFTDSIEEAKEFGDYSLGDTDTQIKEVYLNITNPFDTSKVYKDVFEDLAKKYNIEDQFLDRGDNLLRWFRANKINATEVLKGYGFDGVMDYGHYLVYDSSQIKNVDNNKPTDSEDIRYSLSDTPVKDNEGRTLTKEQQEFFKDSKVRDEKGKLEVMYRGDTGEVINVFDKNKSKKSNLYGTGFYFADENMASLYGNTTPYYLNIVNPLYVNEDTHNITKEQYSNFIKLAMENEDNSFENYGNMSADELINKLYDGRSDFKLINDVVATAMGDYRDAFDVFEKANGIKYDGIISNSQTVVFDSNQIKNIDNTNPTSDPDIRHQISKKRNWNEYLNDNWDLMPEATKTDMKKELLSPIKEQVKEIKKVVSPLKKEISDLKAELEAIKKADLPALERQYEEDFKHISENDIPPVEGHYNDNTEVSLKNKREIVNDIKDKFNIKQQEARDLYNRISDKAMSNDDITTVEDIYNDLADYREVKNITVDKELKDIKSELRHTRINIEDIKSQLTDYRYKDYFGRLRISKEGQPVDAVYQEFSEMYPAYFPSDITTQADQFEYLSDFMNKEVNNKEVYSIDDDTLYNWAEEIYTDIGNRERFKQSQDMSRIANKYMVEPKTPERQEFENRVLKDNEEIEKKLGYTPKDPTKLESYDSIDDMVRAGDADLSGFIRNSDNKPAPKVSESKKSTLSRTWDNFQSDFINRNRQIDNLSKETGNKEIKYKGDRLNNIVAEVNGEINIAQTDNYGNAIGKSLSQVFAPAKESGLYEYFDDYLKHKSNIERHKQGKGSKVDANTSQKYIETYESKYPEFIEWSNDVYQYNKNNLNNGLNNGLISKDFYKHLTDVYKSYVPFYSESDMTPNLNMTLDEIKSSRPVKRASGGASQDSMLSIEKAMTSQTFSWKSAIAKNDLYKEIVNSVGNRADIGADIRIDPTQLDDTLYQDENGKYLTAYVNGERVSVNINDELFKELDRGLEKQIKEWEDKYSAITKPLQKLSQIRGQILTTYSPSFIVTNPIKDIQDALLNTKNFKQYAKDLPSAITDSKKAKDLKSIQESFKKITGEDINTVTDDTNLSNKAKNLYKDYKDAQTWNKFITMYGNNAVSTEFTDTQVNSKAKNIKFLNKIQKANEFMEVMFRYPEFKATLENGGSITEALYNAREVTTNFGRGGTISKAINRNGATFFNTSIQGFDKFIRNFSGENGARGVVSSLSKATMLGIMPAILNHLLFGDDEEYEALPDYIKDNYYLIQTSDGNFIRIPKGRMISVFGSTARRTLEYANGEEDAFKGYGKNVMDQVGPTNPLKENILSPISQAYLSGENGEAWYGGELVPKRLQDKPAGEQFDESTDELSKFLGSKLGISPYKLNYVIDQYSGGIGDIVLPMMTKETTNDSKGVGTILAPIKDKFAVNSTMDNKYSGEFFDLNDEMKKKANSSTATDEDKIKSKYLQSVSSDLGKLYAEKREIQNDSSLSKEEKYEKIKEIQNEINSISKEATENYKNINKTSSYAIVGDKEYYLDDTEWKRVDTDKEDDLNALGMDIDEKSEYFTTKSTISEITKQYSGKENSDEKKKLIIDEVLNTNLTDEQKAYMYSSYYSSDKTLSKITNSGTSFNDYLTYERDSIGLTTDEKESYLAKSSFNKEAKTTIYETSILSDFDNEDKYTSYKVAKASGIDIDNWLDYSSHEFKADKYPNGKTVSGSRKKKVFDYINSSDMAFEQKLIIAKLEYPSYDEYNIEIVNYLNNNDSIDYDTEVYILTNLGMEIDANGNVRW